MGSQFQKKLSRLRKQVDDTQALSLGWRKGFIYSLLGLFVFLIILPQSQYSEEDALSVNGAYSWTKDIDNRVDERVNWLGNVPLFGTGLGAIYFSFSQGVVTLLVSAEDYRETEPRDPFFDFRGWSLALREMIAAGMLRVGFVVIGFGWLWLIGAGLTYYFVNKSLQIFPTKDALGICSKPGRPFYSGLRGTFQPNNGLSGTDTSCPGLACPKLAEKQNALQHPLVKLLKEHHAFNETNLDLVRVILAHHDYPGWVQDESVPDDEEEENTSNKPVVRGYVFEVTITLEDSAKAGLSAVLAAYHLLRRYYQTDEAAAKTPQKSFLQERQELERLASSMSPLVLALVLTLTPKRRRALAELSATAIASAYLAIEAGKVLVYKRQKKDQHVGSGPKTTPGQGIVGFSQVSYFPHLQARAVLHSIPSYHTEYDGDLRLQLRQAVICSRRHSDFGRSFLPYQMTHASRGLRDWLEILYATSERQNNVSLLVELDGYLAELHSNWRRELQRRVTEKDKGNAAFLKQGIAHKSVVLFPLKELIDLALRGVGKDILERTVKLLELTQEERSNVKIRARLPGYARQIGELERSEIELFRNTSTGGPSAVDNKLRRNWLIIRRMLMHYNWLSTRVGDDSVPESGLVKAVITLRREPNTPEVIGLDAVAPLRQQRFKELFGPDWEKKYYVETLHPDDIELFMEEEEFQAGLKVSHQALGSAGVTGSNVASRSGNVH